VERLENRAKWQQKSQKNVTNKSLRGTVTKISPTWQHVTLLYLNDKYIHNVSNILSEINTENQRSRHPSPMPAEAAKLSLAFLTNFFCHPTCRVEVQSSPVSDSTSEAGKTEEYREKIGPSEPRAAQSQLDPTPKEYLDQCLDQSISSPISPPTVCRCQVRSTI